MHDDDVLYVSNATGADLQKLLAIFSGSLSTAAAATTLQQRFSSD
jgi:hypothetical protein